MSAESARKFEALEAQAVSLLDVFKRRGYEQVAPSIIQPADIFLDQIGEAIRGRTYVFTDLTGEELCLRPDLTVPVSRPAIAITALPSAFSKGAQARLTRASFARPASNASVTPTATAPIPRWCCRGRRSEEHTSELQSHLNLVCRLLLEKKKKINNKNKQSQLNKIYKQ